MEIIPHYIPALSNNLLVTGGRGEMGKWGDGTRNKEERERGIRYFLLFVK